MQLEYAAAKILLLYLYNYFLFNEIINGHASGDE